MKWVLLTLCKVVFNALTMNEIHENVYHPPEGLCLLVHLYQGELDLEKKTIFRGTHITFL